MRRSLTTAGTICIVMVLVTILAILLRYIRRSLARTRPSTQGPARASARTGARTNAPEDPAPGAVARTERGPLARSPVRLAPHLGGLTLVAVLTLTLVGGVFFVVVGAPWLLTRQGFPAPPKQPVYFSHEVHVEQAGLDCAFCHRTADRVATAGYPDVQQCMFCHIVADDIRQATQRAAFEGQIAKLRTAWTSREPIEWKRVHRLPDHSRFPHDAHIQAGVPCATCHGDVERMDLAHQVRSLKMGDCVACHQETGAPNDCVDCHY